MFRSAFLPLLLITCGLVPGAGAADPGTRFTGAASCATSGCHGGGSGKNQMQVWQKRDVHSRAHSVLASARSGLIAQQLAAQGVNITDATKSQHCTVCHSPLIAIPPERFVEGAKADIGVSCESCHGPAERWLRSHTRTDYTHEMRVAVGMRELTDFYHRANSCVACHQNIDAKLLSAGHPEMYFELDAQTVAQPPHWKDEGSWLGPRAWMTGQAVALREIAWALSKSPGDADLQARVQGIAWVLRKTEAGARVIPAGSAPGEIQAASDRLARTAAREQWNRDSAMKLLRTLASAGNDFRDAGAADANPVRRRGQSIAQAIDRLWAALKKEGQLTSPNLDTTVAALGQLVNAQAGFEPVKFAAALEQVEVNLELLGKN